MSRLFAVGDIHGCSAELSLLLEALELETGDKIVFVGDYVDRGPDSRGVVESLLALEERVPGLEARFLKGNHEDMLLAYLGEPGHYPEAFVQNGGRATLASYGLTPAVSGPAAAAGIPASHLAFFRRLELWNVHGPVLFVHAGVNPLRRLEDQSEEDLLWIREEFIRNRHRLPYTVIFGHTPQRDVFWQLPYKIGLDTACVYGRTLSCLELAGGRLYQVGRGARKVVVREGLPNLESIAERLS